MAADNPVRVVVVRNSFDKMVAELVEETRDIVQEVADDVENEIIREASLETANSTSQQARKNGLERHVLVGDRGTVFHPGFEEYGTVDQAARPVVTPAGEAQRRPFQQKMKRIESRLKKVGR